MVPQAKEVMIQSALKTTAKNIPINGRPCMIANTGAEPLYFNPSGTATAANGFLVPAGKLLDVRFTVKGNLSVISTATGTNVAVLIFDI